MKKTNKKPTKKVTKSPKKKNTVVAKKVTTVSDSKIQPLGNRVLIKPFTKEELTPKNSFGIILPDSGKEKSEQGMVLAVGSGECRDGKLVPVSVKVGDRVAFSKYGYEDINIDGQELFLIKEENILAILR
ncbi:MAG: co-chaperone GroES [Nitrospira sp.]